VEAKKPELLFGCLEYRNENILPMMYFLETFVLINDGRILGVATNDGCFTVIFDKKFNII